MGTWSVQFDQPLQAGPLDASNWTFRADDSMQEASTATAAGDTVSGDSTTTTLDFGDDVANYGAAPADVIGLDSGEPAAAFSDFPLVVT